MHDDIFISLVGAPGNQSYFYYSLMPFVRYLILNIPSTVSYTDGNGDVLFSQGESSQQFSLANHREQLKIFNFLHTHLA